MTLQDIWYLGKPEMGLLGEGCMGSKKLFPHLCPRGTSPSPYKQIIAVNSVTKFITRNYTAFAPTLYAATIVTYKYNGS